MNRLICLVAALAGLAGGAIARGAEPEPVKIIFDTDMIGDYDDVGALACLHALADAGECEILATVTCTRGNASVAAVEIINGWYGRPDIPVGCTKGIGVSGPAVPGESPHEHDKYLKLRSEYPQWVRHANSDDAPDALDVYRKVLAAQPDGSVTICSVGFLSNLRRLVEAEPELVARKVKLWVAMACQYPRGKEYNSRYDAESSAIALAKWPTPIAFTDFEYGKNVYTGRRIAEDPAAKGPVKDVFLRSLTPRHLCTETTWDRVAGHPSWDETAVLYAVRGAGSVFGLERGTHRMVGTDGSNVWTGDPNSRDRRLVEKLPYAEVGSIIDELMCRPPKLSAQGGTKVRTFGPGVHYLTETAVLTGADSGTVWKAAPGAKPVISGADLASPDGRVTCAFELKDGRPVACVSYGGRAAFTAELGMRDRYDAILSATTRVVRSSWKPVWGFRREYPENYSELAVRLGSRKDLVVAETLYLRCYDEGFAVRSKAVLDTYGLGRLAGERTAWRFAEGTAAWGITSGEATFPADPVELGKLDPAKSYRMPLTVRVPEVGYASVLEADCEHAPRSLLRAERGVLRPRFVSGPLEGRGETLTPWRVVLLAPDAAGLIGRAYLVENLNPPCAIADPSWIRPGFCVSDAGNFPLKTAEIVAAAKRAKATGAKYVQVDWGWYGTEIPWTDDDRASYLSRHPELANDATWVENTKADPYTAAVGTVPYHPYWPYGGRTGVEFDIPAVVAALKELDLGLCLYVHGMVLERVDLDDLFATYEKWGVAGLKPGFVGYGSQAATDFVRRLAATAAKHRLWLDIHDEHLPDGLERTWPNLMITEGGGGEEGNHPVRQDVALPFTRCLAGPFDYTPSLFHYGKARATKLHKLAMFVVYPGPTAVMRGSIRDLVEKDAPAADFLRALPWNYDATYVRDAEIARHLTVVREKDGAFFAGGICGDAAHETHLKCDFLKPGADYAVTLLVDDLACRAKQLGYRRETRTVRCGDTLDLSLAPSGGFCAVFTRR